MKITQKGKIMEIESLYGKCQVRQITFTEKDLIELAHENILNRDSLPYNFDYKHPIIIKRNDGGIIFRFITEDISNKEEIENLNLKSFEDIKFENEK